MSIYYVGADIHKETSTLAIKDENGKTISMTTIQTSEEALKMTLGSIAGTVHLTFEESPYAHWLYDVLSPCVAKLVVCEPRRNRLIACENKNDRVDAQDLADLLRGGYLKPVYHGQQSTRVLRELVRNYERVLASRTQTKNRLCGLFDGYGISTVAEERYGSDPQVRRELIEALPNAGLRSRARILYFELQAQEMLVEQARKEMLAEARTIQAVRWVQTVPGFGDIRAASFVGWLQTPFRFRGKRQVFKYVGLAVVSHTSADWEVKGGAIQRKVRSGHTRGLNRNFHRPLKNIVMGAAMTARIKDAAWGAHADRLVAEGMDREMARLTIARKLTSTVWTLWKKGEPYDAAKAILKS